MDEQFDKKLTNHIREVFDNYEHPDAELGWAKLQEKFPPQQKTKKTAWLWWSSAAAAIFLLFIGITVWYNAATPANNLAANKQTKKQPDNAVLAKTTIKAIDTTATTATIQQPISIAKNITPISKSNTITDNVSLIKTNPFNTIVPENVIITSIPTHKQPDIITTAPAVDSQKSTINIIDQPQLALNNSVENPVTEPVNKSIINKSNKEEQTAKRMASMFAEDKFSNRVKENNQSGENNKKVNFSIYAATYFNYAEGSTNQINAGAGFTSDFRLTNNLKLSTGIALAQNSLSYNDAIPQAANMMFADAAVSMPLKQESLFGPTALVPVFKNYNAVLVGLDIPINIKYEFNPEKSDTYISAGLSSGTFINENYTYKYTYSNGTSSNSNPTDQQSTHSSFNNFYFGKTLNLSFGVGYPLGSNRLIVEPFVKYPLGGLGAQDIRFGAGGINLKFSFKSKKK